MYLNIGKTLGGFHHQVVQRLTWRNLDGMWTYPYLEEVTEEAGM